MNNRDEYCALCSEVLCEPRVLPCLHSYCEECVSLRIGGPVANQTVSCLLCNSVWPAATSIFTDMAAENLLSLRAATGQTKSAVCCTATAGHEEVKAVCYCTDCSSYLCEACVQMHRGWRAFHGHVQIPLAAAPGAAATGAAASGGARKGGAAGTAAKPGGGLRLEDAAALARPVPCPSHPKEKVEFFCAGPDCNAAMCTKCAVCSHQGAPHKPSTVEDAADSLRAALQADMEGFKQPSKHLASVLTAVMARIGVVEKNADSAVADVDRVVAAIQDRLKARRDKLVEEIRKQQRAKTKSLDLQAYGLQTLLGHILHLNRYGQTLLRVCSKAQIAAAYKLLRSRTASLLEEVRKEYEAPSEEGTLLLSGADKAAADINALVDKLGKITTSALSPSMLKLESIVKTHADDTGEVVSAGEGGAGAGGAGGAGAGGAKQEAALTDVGDRLIIRLTSPDLPAPNGPIARYVQQDALLNLITWESEPKDVKDWLRIWGEMTHDATAIEIEIDAKAVPKTIVREVKILILPEDGGDGKAVLEIPIPIRLVGFDRGASCVTNATINWTGCDTAEITKDPANTYNAFGHLVGNGEMSEGKWEWEFKVFTGAAVAFVGVAAKPFNSANQPPGVAWGYNQLNHQRVCPTNGAYHVGDYGLRDGSVVKFEADFPNNRVRIWINGSHMIDLTGVQGRKLFPYAGMMAHPSYPTFKVQLLSQRRVA